MRRSLRTTTGLVLAGAALVALSGCSQNYNDERGKGDAPVQGNQGDNSAAEVFNFPDGFGNLATKCVGQGQRAYTTTRSIQNQDGDKEIEIIPAHQVTVADPECTGP
jgi:hypothetical protein